MAFRRSGVRFPSAPPVMQRQAVAAPTSPATVVTHPPGESGRDSEGRYTTLQIRLTRNEPFLALPRPGHTAEFVSGSASSVLIDFSNSPAGELKYAEAMANDNCAIFGKSSARLESINPRSDDKMRSSYICQ